MLFLGLHSRHHRTDCLYMEAGKKAHHMSIRSGVRIFGTMKAMANPMRDFPDR